ncbi:hypothetical protein RND81_09G133000 [Saponaria officinalis]|uniref:ATP synthase-coupling factor 6, mitochondrial n=1 Tax=Saponaria officinalis TaxID=3572 RepID=A0AAW1IL39_SAPOF
MSSVFELSYDSCAFFLTINVIGSNRVGVSRKELPKYEEQLDLKIAKAQLESLKKECVDAMEAQQKKEEFNDEPMPDVKTLDVRNFL